MIKKVSIKNFKSINDLNMSVGRINLFIGENGSGKSNLLEALVFVSANQSKKLDNEFLSSRGIRVTKPSLMTSSFEKESANKYINIEIETKEASSSFNFYNDNEKISTWQCRMVDENNMLEEEITRKLEKLKDGDFARSVVLNYLNNSNLITDKFEDIINDYLSINIENFLIYSPENTALRTFEKEGQILPLGINGEGLLKLLRVINNYTDKEHIKKIIESLQLFNWFDEIIIPDNITENNIIIKDKYLYQEFDQKSSNEGFLFILFYITLLVAKETPKAFAIDNIDASLNPKLCTKLMTILADLAHKYDKQIFLTTHNPAILDGINLVDSEQKLFVVSRNKKGHTKLKDITLKDMPKSSSDEAVKLSEAFMRGYIGGLPKGF